MTQQHRFLVALKRLTDWYADSVKAQSFDGDRTSSSKPGARVLFSQKYPGTRDWVYRWRAARTESQREEILEALNAELETLRRRPETTTCVDFWRNTRTHWKHEKCAICGKQG